MRVLWFTNTLMPDACSYLGISDTAESGWWMTSLLGRLQQRADLSLAVVTTTGSQDLNFQSRDVDYFIVRKPWTKTIHGLLGSPKSVMPVKSQIHKYASIVREWNPDAIHVHGTENDYGLIKAWKLTEKPVAVSIQGLMALWTRKAYGDLLPAELDGSFRRMTGIKASGLRRWNSYRARMPVEEEILRAADLVLGRTEWDRAWAWAFDPSVKYRHVDEMMRPEFVQAEPWSLASCQQHQIFCTTGGQPIKGLHVLLDSLRRLRQVYPDVRLNVAGGGFGIPPDNDYAKFVHRLIRAWDLHEAVKFLGWTNAALLVEQLMQAHCFVTPSFAENGCNALQEAMLVGVPSVAALTGGLLTTIEPERTGLSFPAGDAALLAWNIHRLFQDSALATRLGAEARMVARDRHDPVKIEEQILRVYHELCGTVIAPR
jgi:glycosyltransferase involved in cell wall biosynthesis